MIRNPLILLIALLTFSTASQGEESGFHHWYEFYQQKLKSDQEDALHLLQQRYSALHPSAEKLYVSGLLFDYLSNLNQPYYGASQRSESPFAKQEALYIEALFDRKQSQYVSAVEKFTTLLSQTSSMEDRETKELLLYQLCYTLNEQGELHRAKHYCSQLLQLIESDGKTLLPAYLSYRIIANNYNFRGEPHIAIAHYQNMLNALPNKSDRSGAFNDIGNQLRELGQYNQAEAYLKDALEIRQRSSMSIELAQVLHSLAHLYRDWRKPEQAILYYRQALDILEKEQHLFGLVMTYVGLGSVYIEQGQFEEGQSLLTRALNAADKAQNYRLSAEVHYGFSSAYSKAKKHRNALIHAEQAYQTALRMEWLAMQAMASLQLSETYGVLGDYKNAYQHHKRYSQLEFRLRDKDTTSALEALDLAQQQLDAQLKIAKLQSDNHKSLLEIQSYQQKKNLYSLLAAATFIIASILVITNQQKKKLTRLDETTGALNRSNAIQCIRQTPSAQKPHCKNVLMLMDLDDFKTVNDLHGYATGDKLLIDISKNLLAKLNRGDLLGRFGGAEFVIMLREIEDIEVEFRVEELQRIVRESAVMTPSQTTTSATASIAFLATARALSDFDELYSLLDQALYHAKKSGRNKTVDVYNPTT
ncbi:tetratricopeptide repeat-containing diguanylate cyclase [Vibrio vulnificus]|uniref:tetratricopeptide repeat-containing diguanylate cyclase n=1 Tax=Vibrio vulnificus TaxID=672 RepID=UPI0032F053FA